MVFEKRNTFRSRRREVRQYRARIIASGVSTGVLLLVGILIWYGARRPEVTISTISVSGGSTVSHELIQNRAESLLSGTYALLIPHTFAFMYPEKEIVDTLNAIPRVHNASVIRSSWTELKITFDEYMPYALWCDGIADASSTPPHCLFVDEQGFAYADAPPLLGETLVRFVTEGRAPEIGAYVYSRDTLSHYRSFVEAIATKHNHRLRAITETQDGDLVLHLSGDVDLLMRMDANIQEIFENIESLFQADEFEGLPLETFEYIDLRFGNKVYVKKRGAGEEEPAPESTDASPVVTTISATTPTATGTATTSNNR